MEKTIVTVLTASYNRLDKLPALYNSLCQQTDMHFEWIVVDDGSSDGTESYITGLKNDSFQIKYYRKANGGKHTALNFSHPYICGELVFMVDSDDYLDPDAIGTVIQEWSHYRNNAEIGVLSFRKKLQDGRALSAEVQEPYVEDDISFRLNHHISGDRSEVIRTDLFIMYPFPEFKNEKFMSEGWLFRKIAYDYKTVYLNKAIYVCEYLDEGLSKAGRALRAKCPLGMMENNKTYFHKKVSVKVQLRQQVAYFVYAMFAKKRFVDIIRESGIPVRILLTAPLGFLTYIGWKKKYEL